MGDIDQKTVLIFIVNHNKKNYLVQDKIVIITDFWAALNRQLGKKYLLYNDVFYCRKQLFSSYAVLDRLKQVAKI